MSAFTRIAWDPGHGMSNIENRVFDSGAVCAGVREADIALAYATELRDLCKARGIFSIRTRRDNQDPCPVSRRDDVAMSYECDAMVSIHCNSAGPSATGAEVFFRGEDDRSRAVKLAKVVSEGFGIPNRGAKTEDQSQHKRLAVMEFDKCWLIELGFITHPTDRARMLDAGYRRRVCEAILEVMTSK